jgi:hypothetical protein
MSDQTAATPQITPETPEVARKRRRWLLWVVWIGRAEMGLAALVGLGICAGLFIWGDQRDLFLALWKLLVVPSYLIGMALTLFVARAVKRPPGGVLGELSFWAVFPASSFLMLFLLQKAAATGAG